jgi:hypothetical protein
MTRKAPDMTNVLSAEQADKIVPRSKRAQAQYEASLAAREEHALEELAEIGFRVTLYEPREYVEPDELLGRKGGWKVGVCHAVVDSIAGKRKSISEQSAVAALAQARSWLRYQQERLSLELRFVIAKENVAVPVLARAAGDAAETAARRAATERRVIDFDADGTAQVVDSHGDPITDAATKGSPDEHAR